MRYEVIVGNIGTVYDGPDKAQAESDFEEYVEQSETRSGRAGGEQVVLMAAGEMLKEYFPNSKPLK